MSSMMAGPQTYAYADSGYGVKMAGFFGPVRDFANQMKIVNEAIVTPRAIATWEQEGYITFLAAEYEPGTRTTVPKIAFYRREIDKFFPGLQSFLFSIRATRIDQISVCGSGGSLCLSVVYHPAPEVSV